ncbi:MAG: hypothetical protein WC729_18575 [Sphingomonas sp.]|uniref:hypothetical protein n=1 Tax=Sphingomonas sp. TaxID=28214 RepID=UPI0035643830
MMYMMPAIIAAAAAASGQSPQGVTSAPVDTSRKICRMIVPTGTIMARRFCLTKLEWDELNNRTEASASAALARRGTGTCNVSCDR